MDIPDGWKDPSTQGKVCRLRKALYGLRQSPRAWYSKIDSYLKEKNLQRSAEDYNLYFSIRNDKYTIILLYVDDLFITGDDEKNIQNISKHMMETFEMTNLGRTTLYLGAEIETDSVGIWLHQRRYIQKLLTKFRMDSCKPASVPMISGVKLQRDIGSIPCNATQYRSLVGSLIHLRITRQDVMFAVNSCSKYMEAPQEAHLVAAKHILRYLKGTMNYGILYEAQDDGDLMTFVDSDYARDLDTRKSVFGILHKFGTTPIHWSSKMQETVALSTTKAEYRALSEGAKDLAYLRRLFEELGICQRNPTMIYSDNMSCIKLANNPVMHSRTKHIELQHHYVREKVANGSVEISLISTFEQEVDLLTKPLYTATFEKLREISGIQKLPECYS